MSRSHTIRRVAVIGAGVAGLTTARALLREGFEVTVFEKTAHIGGVWVYRADEAGGVHARTFCTSSKQMTQFSDFPMPDSYPDFPTHAQVRAYLEAYARDSGLHHRIRFGCALVGMAQHGAAPRWRLQIRSGDHIESLVFDAVCVCTGNFARPHRPEIPGQESFQGEQLHSNRYKHSAPFEGKRVVVVGCGETAFDIAAEVSHVAAQTWLSVRRGVWLMPRYFFGAPLDHLGCRLLFSVIPRRLELEVGSLLGRLASGDHRQFGLHPGFSMHQRQVVKSWSILPRLANGSVLVRPDLKRLTPYGAQFRDGSAEDADTVIFATGFRPALPRIDATLTADGIGGLYRYILHPQTPSVAWIGFTRVWAASIFPIMEMQGRWAASVFAGRHALPSVARMQAQVRARNRADQRCFGAVGMVDPPRYMASLARDIGAMPRMRRWLKQPSVMRKVMLGLPLSTHFRLDGPDSWDGAAALIRRTRRGQPSGHRRGGSPGVPEPVTDRTEHLTDAVV
ncbi:MAG: FAD-dependent oxidoreductase [Myxococcota bacterium]